MATNNGLPSIDIIFKGLGVTALKRGERGYAVLIVEDDTPGENKRMYRSIADLTSEEQAKFTSDNVKYIKDALEGTPLALYVFKLATEGQLTDLLNKIKGIIPRNSWIAIQSATSQKQNDLVTFIKAENKNNKKKYKGMVYNATTPDDMHIVNQKNEKVTFLDDRGEVTGDKAISYLLGFYAGLSMMMSGIAKPLKFVSVVEPENIDDAISRGEHILFNDEGEVKVARAVNSLTTLGQDVTEEMTFINTVEKMDLIYCDILHSFKNSYQGKYPNILDNQMLLISAINGYFKGLAIDKILDPAYDSRAKIDIEEQKIANYSKYGEEVVNTWDEQKIMKMTVGPSVFLEGDIKIAGIMEEFKFKIYM